MMLRLFSLEVDALAVEIDSAVTCSQHHSFLKLWDQYGILIYPSPFLDETKLVEAVKKLPQSLRKRWELCLKRARCQIGPEAWHGKSSINEPTDLSEFEDVVEVLFVSDVTFVALVGDETEPCMQKDAIELCRFDCATASTSLVSSKKGLG